MSTTTSGGTISTMFPWPIEIARSRVGWLMTAAEKSMSDVAVPGLHRQAARHHPGSVPLDRAVGDLQLHQVLGRRGRGEPGAGGGGQVDQENLELSVGARGQRGLQPFVEFLGGEPTVPGRDPELLRDLVAVLVGHAQVPFVGGHVSRHVLYCNARRKRPVSVAV